LKKAEIFQVRDFVIGNLYFIVRYPDCEQLLIVPKSVVFIGKNVRGNEFTHGNEELDTWYFQDTTSYCVDGPEDFSVPSDIKVNVNKDLLRKATVEGTVTELFALQENKLDEVVDYEGLARILVDFGKRRAKADRST
jgi:hypothetical protein